MTHPRFQASGSEYWSFLEGDAFLDNPCEEKEDFFLLLPEDPPVGIHYCQEYGLFPNGENAGGPFFYKYAMPTDLLSCEKMALQLPPADEWLQASRLYQDNKEKQERKRVEVWTECTLIKILNQVTKKIKRTQCTAKGFNTFQGILLEKKPDPAPEP